ncbi:hypothetical protein [Francisella sp. TX07-6608]|uniref:hypothetical protein n=1 Tax=Francisella sp. TX07-6608 TaxID=573568 RepID=UPI001160DB55|nr:hypothetical protein [Francisella sp. TX07-6608]
MAVKKHQLDKLFNTTKIGNTSSLVSIIHNKSSKTISKSDILKPNTNSTQLDTKPNTNSTQLDTKPNTNSTQLDTKPNTNSTQLDTKPNTNSTQLDTKPNTNSTQLDTKPNTNSTQFDTKPNTNSTQLDTKPNTNSTQLDTKPNTNSTQLDTKPNTNSTQLDTKPKNSYNIHFLSGNEKQIFVFIAEKIENSIEKKMSPPLTKKEISIETNIALGSINTSIHRLIKKNIIIKLDAIKGGKNATTIYSIPSKILNDFRKNTIDKNIASPYIYNNTIYNNKTNNNESYLNKQDKSELLSWDIDYSLLNKYGFKKSHLNQLSKVEGLTEEVIQESIYHYAWALENNFEEMKKKYDSRFEKNPLGLLIGTLKKGNEWIEAGYKSPEELAEEQIFQAKRQRLERIKKEKAEKFNIEFELWFEELTQDKKHEIFKKLNLDKIPKHVHEEAYQKYFKDNVYED